jgi:hypothetical protein
MAPESLTFVSVWSEALSIRPMQKCPVKPKTSVLRVPTMGKPKYRSPAELADIQGCSERTIREWCKQGVIPEASTTKGHHWRIRMPLSMKTRYELEKRRDDWPFKGQTRDLQGDFSEDIAERLLLTQFYQLGLYEKPPVPYLAELPDVLTKGFIAKPISKKEILARKIQDLIMKRFENGESLSDLLLTGWVYHVWHEKQRCPTVEEIAELMGISRDTFYRRGHTRQEIERAYLTASGESKRDLPDPDGFNPVQRANRKARKPGFERLHHDYDPPLDSPDARCFASRQRS